MGQAFGEECKEEIAHFLELRIANAIRQSLRYGGQVVGPSEVMEAALSCVAPTRDYDPIGYQELLGIAEGAHLTIEQVIALNGLTDIRDILSWPGPPESIDGCSAFIAQRDLTRDKEVFCGQTWDLATDNLPYVLGVHRKPNQGPQTWTLTTVGCLSLIGLNEAGLAIGTTNVRTVDSRPGVTYLSIIHKVLRQTRTQDAVEAIEGAHRAGAHFYYLADAHGAAMAFECSATKATRIDVNHGHYAHTNHCLVPANIAIQGHEPQDSSLARIERLDNLLDGTRAPYSAQDMMSFLGDEENGTNAICRDDFGGINTNGAVVMAPQSGRIWACHGLPGQDNWVDMKA